MRKDKIKAFQLRKQGKSYNKINKILGISKSTLSVWFKNEDWSFVIKAKIIEKTKSRNMERIKKMNLARKNRLEILYEETRIEAKNEFKLFKKDPFFISGIMLYWGEGDKSKNSGIVRISNIDFPIIKIFFNFLIKFCKIDKEKIKFWLLLYPDNNEKECKMKWNKKTGIPLNNFYKTQVIKGRHKTKRLIYGVGNIIISNKCLKEKILEWIRLSEEEFAK